MQEKKRKFFFCDRMSEMKEQKGQLILAVSGVKNSGKTTLIASLLSKLKQKGLKAAVIKHDGHEFEADIPGTDTWRFGEAGACGTLVFSGTKYMMVKYQPSPETDELIACFPEADVVLLEGFKYSLDHYRLTTADSGLTVSNEIVSEKAKVTYQSGTLLMIMSRD